ncbi:MAG: polymorphic toxin type 50 domain-containing protein [Candidatus Poribacteria bacterium]|nr:polymorphic toxin type 50 domain-containing protein [Candidatus Poribacteria bacterium]
MQHGNKEVVDFGEVIGIYVDPNGNRMPTTRGTIHYDSKGYTHIVPAKPNL